MHRVVVTSLRDELITNVNVKPEELDPFIASYAVINDTCIYIDGRPLLPAQRIEFLRAYYAATRAEATPNASTAAPAPLPTREEITTWMEIMHRGVEHISQGFAAVQQAAAQQHQLAIQQQRDAQAAMKAATEMHLEMQRGLADEAVRQRKLCAQSLGDIDLLHRALKTAQINEDFARRKAAHGQGPASEPGPGPQVLAHPASGMCLGDVWRGFVKTVEQQFNGEE